MTKQKDEWIEVNPMNIDIWNNKDENKQMLLKENDELIGTYMSSEENVGPNNSKMYTIKKDDDSLLKVWGCHILDSRFDYIEIGERVKIVFLGSEMSEKNKRKYWNYQVYHTKATHKKNEIPKTSEEVKEKDIPVIEEGGPQFTEDEEIDVSKIPF